MPEAQADILTVSELNRLTRDVIEAHFPLIWLQGELSNLARPASGHWYFTLKDEQAQVRCAMFRMKNRVVTQLPENGMQVLVRARVSFYEARGEFQLIIEQLEAAGDGLLRQRFLRLKNSLEQRGWFDPEHKKPLPVLPRRIGVITSISGAALRDILSVTRRRYPGIALVVLPVTVQGEAAAATLVQAIGHAQALQIADVLILARGGGSLEDLWCFNDEGLAQAIFNCTIPIVTGIGHEIDFTIADFVADCRAATPSAAAELVVPQKSQLLAQVAEPYRRMRQHLHNRMRHHAQQLIIYRQALRHPTQQLQVQAQRVDELEQRLGKQLGFTIERLTNRLGNLQQQLRALNPAKNLLRLDATLQLHQHALQNALNVVLERKRSALLASVRHLDAVSPLATLSRGFAIVTSEDDARVIRSCEQVTVGDQIRVQLAKGGLVSEIKQIEPQRMLEVESKLIKK